uniref:Solute carrier organic anion transporter family member n=1 Tax=Salvator merianae TaxID=96440 RepID=A0A8D0BRP7_SALMN
KHAAKTGLKPKKKASELYRKTKGCLKFKIFLGALAFSFFAKGFSGSYMKSVMIQIERRFEIPSFIVGLIDGSFELGNLLVLVIVSYLGSKVNRPRVIAVGCLIMSIGSFTSALSHFIMGRSSSVLSIQQVIILRELFSGISPVNAIFECEKTTSSYLWLIVLAGNLLRGVGEAPVMPLGLSYIDDFATEQNSAFYIGKLSGAVIGMLGPMLGFLVGSVCADLWVDIGAVDTDTLTINSRDTRWVGAWWLGILVSGVLSIVASLPFWFLPHSLSKQGERGNVKNSNDRSCTANLAIKKTPYDFFPTLKKLLGNPIFLVYLVITILNFNIFVGSISYDPKYIEQQFNVSVSKAIFLIGVIIMPVVILGLFLGGFIIKKFKLCVMGMAKFASSLTTAAFLLFLLVFMFNCETLQVAGLTVNYSGAKESSFSKRITLSDCNSACNCETSHWDPVCGSNGITYMSACLAGCNASTGIGKDMVFHNCSCVGVSGPGNLSAALGQCPRDNCTKVFPYYLALKFVNACMLSLAGSPLYMIISVSPDVKSFAIGIETLCGGFPSPIYFGALIDRTCLKWGTKPCGERGSCRVYDVQGFRNNYLGLTSVLKGGNCIFFVILCILIAKRFRQDDKGSKAAKNTEVFTIKLPATSPKEIESSCTDTAVTEDTHF